MTGRSEEIMISGFKIIKNGTRFYDEMNGRYITTDGTGTDPRCWSCIVEEMNDEGEYEVTGRQIFTENELKHFKEVIA